MNANKARVRPGPPNSHRRTRGPGNDGGAGRSSNPTASDSLAPLRTQESSGPKSMEKWLAAALDYIPEWIDFQMRLTEQPGAVIAVRSEGKLVLERAFGHADAVAGVALTPRHRFRVASHSKSFTAAG